MHKLNFECNDETRLCDFPIISSAFPQFTKPKSKKKSYRCPKFDSQAMQTLQIRVKQNGEFRQNCLLLEQKDYATFLLKNL